MNTITIVIAEILAKHFIVVKSITVYVTGRYSHDNILIIDLFCDITSKNALTISVSITCHQNTVITSLTPDCFACLSKLTTAPRELFYIVRFMLTAVMRLVER